MADDSLKRAAEILSSLSKHKKEAKSQLEKDRHSLVRGVASDVVKALAPALNRLVEQSRLTRGDIERIVSKIKVETHTPDVIIPEIAVPKAEITVRSPKINMPDVVMPDEMNIKGFVKLMGVDLDIRYQFRLETLKEGPSTYLKILQHLFLAVEVVVLG